MVRNNIAVHTRAGTHLRLCWCNNKLNWFTYDYDVLCTTSSTRYKFITRHVSFCHLLEKESIGWRTHTPPFFNGFPVVVIGKKIQNRMVEEKRQKEEEERN